MLSYVAQEGHGFSILFYASLGEVSSPFSSFATEQNEAIDSSTCPASEVPSQHQPFRNCCPTHTEIWIQFVLHQLLHIHRLVASGDYLHTRLELCHRCIGRYHPFPWFEFMPM